MRGGLCIRFLIRQRARTRLPSECVNMLLYTMGWFVKESSNRTTTTTNWETRNGTQRHSAGVRLPQTTTIGQQGALGLGVPAVTRVEPMVSPTVSVGRLQNPMVAWASWWLRVQTTNGIAPTTLRLVKSANRRRQSLLVELLDTTWTNFAPQMRGTPWIR